MGVLGFDFGTRVGFRVTFLGSGFAFTIGFGVCWGGFGTTFGDDSPRAGVGVSELESEAFGETMMEQGLEAMKASGIDTGAMEELIAGIKLQKASEGGDGTA